MQIYRRPIVVIKADKRIRNRSDIEQFDGEPIFVYYNGHNHYDAFLLTEGTNNQEVLNALLALPPTDVLVPQPLTQFNEQPLLKPKLNTQQQFFVEADSPFIHDNNKQNLNINTLNKKIIETKKRLEEAETKLYRHEQILASVGDYSVENIMVSNQLRAGRPREIINEDSVNRLTKEVARLQQQLKIYESELTQLLLGEKAETKELKHTIATVQQPTFRQHITNNNKIDKGEADAIQLTIMQNRLEQLENAEKTRPLSEKERKERDYLHQELQHTHDNINNRVRPNFT